MWRHNKISLYFGLWNKFIGYICVGHFCFSAICIVIKPKIVWFIKNYILSINKLPLVKIKNVFVFVDDFNNWLPDNTRNVTTRTTARETKSYYYSIIIGFT